jgi:chemotaxis protein CheX
MSTQPIQLAGMVDSVARAVISTMTGLNVDSSEHNSTAQSFTVNGVAGVVGLAGGLSANVHFVLSEPAARTLVGSILGSNTFGDADLRDAIGELTNMIAGGLKNRLDQAGYTLNLTVPSFIRGQETQITAKGFTMGALNSFSVHGIPDPVRVVVCAKPNS